DARDGSEAVQDLAVDAERVDLALWALCEPESRDAEFAHAGASSLCRRWLKTNKLWNPRRLLRSVPRKMTTWMPTSAQMPHGHERHGRSWSVRQYSPWRSGSPRKES